MDPENLLEEIDAEKREYRSMEITEGPSEGTCLIPGAPWPFPDSDTDYDECEQRPDPDPDTDSDEDQKDRDLQAVDGNIDNSNPPSHHGGRDLDIDSEKENSSSDSESEENPALD